MRAVEVFPVPRGPSALPRLDFGLAVRGLPTAAVDVSDGLIADLGHIAQASAPNTLVRTFHVTFAGGGAGVQVPGDTCRGEIWAPFEEPASD